MGGGMLRTVGRAVGAGMGGVQEAFSASRFKSSRVLTLACEQSGAGSSSSSSAFTLPVSAAATLGRSLSAHFCDGDEWIPVEEEEEEEENVFGFSDRYVFGSVPSKEEVEDAVSALQQVIIPVAFPQVAEDGLSFTSEDKATEQVAGSTDLMCKAPSTEIKPDWVEPVLHLYNQKMLRSEGCNKVADAFQMLQMNPSIQRMVISLSSDKSVWDAVLNNEVVQELRESFYAVKNNQPEIPDKSPDAPTRVLRWILENTKAKMIEVIDKITNFVNELFQPLEKGKKMDLFDEALRSSVLLSVIVLLVVVVSRLQKA